jgi:DNA polymerase (family 10)
MRRDEYEIDFEQVLKAAVKTGPVLEINSFFERPDLNDANILRAKKAGIRMCVNTDAHRADQLHQMTFGVAQAHRGWADKQDIINGWPVEKLLDSLR